MNRRPHAIAASALIASAATTLTLSFYLGSPAAAVVLFSDNFNANSTGLNTTPNTWTISNNGAVDLIGNGFYNLRPEFIPYRIYVDLDGSSPGGPGLLTNSVGLTANETYTLQFDLAGNQRNTTTDIVSVHFGAVSRQINVDPNALFTTYSLVFTPPSSGLYDFSFLSTGSDMEGATLDNVSVFTGEPPSVPAPLPLLGIGAATHIRHRIRRGQRNKLG
ncbi:MAG: hypothetical protein VKJ05_02785 [Synechococcaceae cyanobacterium]|nr:hypothetical protein [Synechococcaceae cyanobacterium]